MRSLPYAIGVGVLLLLLTWLLMRGMNFEARSTEETLHALDRMAIAQSGLQRDILRARSGLLKNYDPINAELDALRDSFRSLRRRAGQPAKITAAMIALAAALAEQENLTEKFKSTNAVLQNSLSYFSLFSTWLNTDGEARQPPAPIVSALTVSLLRLTLDASPEAAREVAHLLNYLGEQYPAAVRDRTVAGLIAHGRILHRALPQMDGLLKGLERLPIEAERETVRMAVREHARQAEVSAQHHRYVLYSLSLLLLGGLVAFALRLRSRAENTRRRAALEQVIARISARLVNAPHYKIDECIETALSELAGQIGADRAYLVAPGSPARIYSWCRDGASVPGDWPEAARNAAADIARRAGDVIHVSDVRRLDPCKARRYLDDAGIGSWTCIEAPDGQYGSLFLGFDAAAARSMTVSDEASLLRMALDPVADALHRQKLEAERSRLEGNLQKARRMETVGALASGIAHNFNNIICAILGYAEIAQTQAAGGRLATSLEGIHAAGRRAQELIEQILAFGRRTDPRREPVALRELLEESRAMLAAALPSRIELSIREGHGTDSISGEAGQLQQVILNLCTNAAQAMGEHGRILIETRAVERAAAVQLSHGVLPPGRYCIIAVEDHGRGMNAATAKRIFEPFFTTRAAGNGLGLATVREIVSDHGGAIDVRSTPGAGTRFEVWLPCGVPVHARDAGDHRGGVILGQGETILVIAEDRKSLLRDEEMLAALGYEPVGFILPDEALAACRASPGRFDAAVVKQGGPDATLSLASAVHLAAPRLPILLAAASGDDHSAEALMNAGVSELMRKPLTSSELASVLARCIPRVAEAPRQVLRA